MFEQNDLLKILINYNFKNFYRGEKNVSSFLDEHFKNYFNDVQLGLKGNNDYLDKSVLEDIESNLATLTDISASIIDIVKLFEDGHIKQAYDQAYKLFDKYKDLFLTEEYNHNNSPYFTRLRSGKFKSDEKKELFHVPQNKSELIGAYRYSIAGFPCLYLASDLELCWYECGMPKEYSYCYMKIAENEKLKLINFKERPIDLFSSYIVNLYNAQNKGKKDKIENINKIMVKYILLYPLMASCSLIVKDRNKKYISEYIMPQLLMQWIKESDDYDGIASKSSVNCNLKEGMGSFNVTLPVKEFREDGFCKHLTQKLVISDVYNTTVIQFFKKEKSKLVQQIISLKYEIELFMIHSQCNRGNIHQMINICDYIILNYMALIENKYVNSELIFNFINCLYSYISMLKTNQESIIKNTIISDGCEQERTNDSEIKKINEIFDKFFKLTEGIVKQNQGFYITHGKKMNYCKL